MRKLKPINPISFNDIQWELENCQNDIQRIIKICKERNFEISPENATIAWILYSESISAGWIDLFEEDDLIFFVIAKHLEIHS